MPTHVALLRGINVGGSGKIPMAELRAQLAGSGFADVATYIQSGNVVLSSADPDPATVAETIATLLRDHFGVPRPVVVFGRDEYAAAVSDNPFPQLTEPKQLHAVFRGAPPTGAELAALEEAVAAARAKGSRDSAAVVGRVVYLHLPDGMGRSELGARLSTRTKAPDGGGTARNWATVRALFDLLG